MMRHSLSVTFLTGGKLEVQVKTLGFVDNSPKKGTTKFQYMALHPTPVEDDILHIFGYRTRFVKECTCLTVK